MSLFTSGSASESLKRLKGSSGPPPELLAAMQAVTRVIHRLPSEEWRAAVDKLRFAAVPYVVCALYDWRLDDPLISAEGRRVLQERQKEARAALEKYKAARRFGSRPRGAPAAGTLSPTVLDRVLSTYRERVAAAGSKGRDHIWRSIAREVGYSNWKKLRQQVMARAHLRSV